MDNTIRIENFVKFYNNLMKGAPSDYKPWLFPCGLDKGPAIQEIIRRAPANVKKKGSWEAEHARLSFDEAVEVLNKGLNVGISARIGDPLVIVDVDSDKVTDQVERDTLISKSRKRVGLHAFYWAMDDSVKINFPIDDGEIRSSNQYVLAPGSYVPFPDEDLNKEINEGAINESNRAKINDDKFRGYYTVEVEKPLKSISFNALPQFFKEAWIKENIEQEKVKQRNFIKNERLENDSEMGQLFKLKVSDIVGYKKHNKRMAHPLHASDTGANFSMSPDSIICHCWRHLVSLNGFQYLCVKSGKYSCQDAGTPHKGRGFSKVTGDKEAYKIALEQAKEGGLIKEVKKKEPIKKKEHKLMREKLRTLTDLLNNGVPPIEWVCDKLVRKGGITIFGGTSGTFKSWTAMELAICCVTGQKFLDQFDIKQCPVVYVDEEMGDIVTLNRFKALKNGKKIENEKLSDLHVSIFNNAKLDNTDIINELRHIIQDLSPGLIVFDSMVRCMEGDEDKSQEVRVIFDNLKELMKLNETAFIILHHTAKGQKGLNSLRGSGDFAAFADVVLMFYPKKSGEVNVGIEKNRHIDTFKLKNFNFKVESNEEENYFRLNFSDFNVEDVSERDRCVEDIKTWITEEDTDEFKSKQAWAVMEGYGYKKNTFYDAMKELVKENIVNKGSKRGNYDVVGKGTKIEEFFDN